MKHIYLHLILISLLIAGKALAQSSCRGVITDSDGKPLEFAAVMLSDAGDSLQYIGTVTDSSGYFEFNQIIYPRYVISVTMVGYEKVQSQVYDAGDTSIVRLTLPESGKTLNEFIVESKVNKIEFEPGKTIMNVENTSLSVGQNSLDLLRKIPGVFVDNNGNISIKGKKDVNVMIDGKPTYMSGEQLKNFLQSLNADNISKIEVITQPGANYDAEGNAGIVNIILKKKVLEGFNGSLSAYYGQGFYPKAGGNFSFNYGKGKWNINGSYSYNFRKGYIWPQQYRLIGDSEYEQDYWGTSISNNHALRFSFDYAASKKVTIGAGVNAMIGHSEWQGFTRSWFRDTTAHEIDSIQILQDRTPWQNYNVQANFNVQWKLDTLGQQLKFNLDGGGYLEQTTGHYDFGFYDSSYHVLRQKPDVDFSMAPKLYLVAGKVDYENPHFFGFKLEAGLKSSYVTNQAFVQYQTYDSNLNPVIIPGQTNEFIYEENINAFYLTMKREVKKWSFTAGLRGEHTNVTGRQITINQVNRQNYFSLFPNVGIAFNPSDKHSFSFSYNRRIDRPEYGELNPFIYVMDNYSSYQGNPKLLPQFSNNFELSYTLMQALTFSASYSLINNSITDVFRVDSANAQRLIFTKANIGNSHTFTGGVTFMMPVTKWWTIMINANAIYNNVSDSALNIHNEGWYGMFSGYFEFSLPAKFTIELNGYALTSQPAGQQNVLPLGDFSAGVSKKLLKDKLVLKFNVSDIFRTSQWRTNTRTETGQQFYSTFWWDSRVFTFSVNWSFGNSSNRYRQKNNDSFDRVGGGR